MYDVVHHGEGLWRALKSNFNNEPWSIPSDFKTAKPVDDVATRDGRATARALEW